MARNNSDFDGYHKWLGITSARRPPTHYEILGINLNEDDHEVIQSAAELRRNFVESKRHSGRDSLVAEIIMRIDEAEITLLSSEMRRDYDRQLNLFEKRRKNRQVDPFVPPSRMRSRPGPTVGEDNGIVKTYAGIVSVLGVAFAVMATFAFNVLPWSKQPEKTEPSTAVRLPQPVPEEMPLVVAERLPTPARASAPEKPIQLTSPFTAVEAKAAQEGFARWLGTNVIEKNSLGMQFVLIPPGRFMMGDQSSEKGQRKNEIPAEVTLTSPFWLGKTEVTQGQWRKIMGTTPWRRDEGLVQHHSRNGASERLWQGKEYIKEGEEYAATCVSWNDAQAFIKELSQHEGMAYRLPTEAEWEWSCRAGTSTRWSFGEDEFNLGQYAWYGGIVGHGNTQSEHYAHEVGKRLANPFNLNDMHGNVWEWCEDIKANDLPGGTDPKVTSGGQDRVARGGSWWNNNANSASRYWNTADYWYYDVGFRIVRAR